MWYVYLIKSRSKDWHYVGLTDDLKRRIAEHNAGENQSTTHYAPFELEAYVALPTQQKAAELEQYFKTGSGRAFWKRRLIRKR